MEDKIILIDVDNWNYFIDKCSNDLNNWCNFYYIEIPQNDSCYCSFCNNNFNNEEELTDFIKQEKPEMFDFYCKYCGHNYNPEIIYESYYGENDMEGLEKDLTSFLINNRSWIDDIKITKTPFYNSLFEIKVCLKGEEDDHRFLDILFKDYLTIIGLKLNYSEENLKDDGEEYESEHLYYVSFADPNRMILKTKEDEQSENILNENSEVQKSKYDIYSDYLLKKYKQAARVDDNFIITESNLNNIAFNRVCACELCSKDRLNNALFNKKN